MSLSHFVTFALSAACILFSGCNAVSLLPPEQASTAGQRRISGIELCAASQSGAPVSGQIPWGYRIQNPNYASNGEWRRGVFSFNTARLSQNPTVLWDTSAPGRDCSMIVSVVSEGGGYPLLVSQVDLDPQVDGIIATRGGQGVSLLSRPEVLYVPAGQQRGQPGITDATVNRIQITIRF